MSQDYIIEREVFEDGEWQVTTDIVPGVSGIDVEGGEDGVITFEGHPDTLIVSRENFIAARTEGVR